MPASRSSTRINEGSGYTAIISSVPPPCFEDINVKYSISAGTATANSDFIPASGTLYMSAAGNTGQVGLRVNIIDDSLLEDDETVILTLLPGEGYELGTQQKLGERKTMTVTIADDDTPRPSFDGDDQLVSEAAGTANVTVNVSPPPPSATTLNYTVGGTATAGSDFTVTNSVSMPAGATSVTIPVTIT
ncbi:Calx-beta domain-containing protein, partial [Candidatus Synechococcus spongiarum]|uniref:Calx-beta domain-containing protein n=1 Tax=Candidatus Synechococcus spongiarum TaxID=431041 RepID=UPI001F17978C